MFDGGMTMCFQTANSPLVLLGNLNKSRTQYRRRPNPSVSVQMSSIFFQNDENGNQPESKKILGSVSTPNKCKIKNSMLTRVNTVGIIGGASVFSTLIFLEKLVWWSSRNGEESVPFVVCSDPAMDQWFPYQGSSSLHSSTGTNAEMGLNHYHIIQNLRHKRVFLEQSGARCIVMPCHMSHVWYGEISEGSSILFLHVGECVAAELKDTKLKPHAGSHIRIGVLATHAVLKAGFYQEKLQNLGFEAVLPDKATMEHILIPAFEAFRQKDMEGARNLLRIAIQVLLIRAVNVVILASDELTGLLPRDDPLLKKCIDPMDALARATLKWAESAKEVQKKT